MIRRRRALASALLLLVACGGEGQEGAVEDPPARPVARIAPEFSLVLRRDGNDPLDPREILETDSALYLLDGRSDELWIVKTRVPGTAPRLAGSLRQFGQRRVFALASHPRGFGAIGADGVLRLMADTAPAQLVHTWHVPAPLGRPFALGATADGGWLMAQSVLGSLPGGAMPYDSTLVLFVDSTGAAHSVWGAERVGPLHPDAFITDRVGGTAFLDTVTLAGASPVRVITVTRGGAVIDTLRDAPRRELNARERAGLQSVRSGARAPHLRIAALPKVRPAALSARRLGSATVVSAQAGEAHLALDLYCDRSFRLTLLEAADLSQLHLGNRGVAALRDHLDEGYVRLEYYAWAPIAALCGR